MQEYINIGSSPCDEDCAKVGAANYHELSKLELAAFQKAIIAKCGEPPDGARLGIKDREVVCFYDPENEKATEYAFKCEGDSPATWEEVGMKAPRLDDPEFTKTELIPAPNPTATESEREQIKRGFLKPGQTLASGEKVEPRRGEWIGTAKCDLAGTRLAARECNPNPNEFIDGAMKIGQWANMCPACFGKNGRGLGKGVGQRYKKATDGKFYKVEG